MAEVTVEKQIQARLAEIFDAYNKEDFERLVTYYTPDAYFMDHAVETLKGWQEFKESFKKVKIMNKCADSFMEKMTYFELFDDSSAYCNLEFSSIFKLRNDKISRRATILWRKLKGEWYMERVFLNFREVNEQDQVKKYLKSRMIYLDEVYSRNDIEAGLKVYMEDATWMVNEQEQITGKTKAKKMLMQLIPTMKTLVFDDIFYFEMFGEDTALTDSYINSVNENGKIFNRIRACTLWKKIGNEWFISRDIINDVPLVLTQCTPC